MFTSAYIKVLGERAVVLFAAALAAVLTADGFNVLDLSSWKAALFSAAATSIVGIVVSIAGGAATTSKAPAMTSKETENALASVPKDQPYL